MTGEAGALVEWLTGVLDAEEARAIAMRQYDWPREVWVSPADMQGWELGEFAGSVSVHEYAPKRYARINAGDLARGDRWIDHGWSLSDRAVEVWSADIARAVLARVEAERAVIAVHETARMLCPPAEEVRWDEVAHLAWSAAFEAWAKGGYEGPEPHGTRWRHYCTSCEPTDGSEDVGFPCPTLRLLAYGHRYDAPGYRDQWRPEGVEVTG